MKRRTALALTVAATAAPAIVRAQPSPIRIGVQRSDAQVVVQCAAELGMFQKAGLDVTVETLTNSGVVMSGVIGGTLDAALCDDIQLGTAVLRGIPVAGFAGGALFTAAQPTLVLTSLKSGTIRSAKDLSGQTIGVIQLHSQSSVATQEWLRTRGVDVSSVKLYEIGFPEMIPAMQRGVLGAAFLGEPFLSVAKDELFWLGVPFEAIAKVFYINSYFASRDWLANNRDTVRKLTAVLYDAARWTNSHHAESAVIEAAWTKIDPDRLRVMARNTFSTSFEARYYQPVLDIGARYQLLPQKLAAADIMAVV